MTKIVNLSSHRQQTSAGTEPGVAPVAPVNNTSAAPGYHSIGELSLGVMGNAAAAMIKRRAEIDRLVKGIILTQMPRVKESQIVDTAEFLADLGADALDVATIVMEAEDEFHIAITDEEAERVLTVRDLVVMVQRKLCRE